MISRSKINEVQEARYRKQEKIRARIQNEFEKRMKDSQIVDPTPMKIFKVSIS